MRPIAEAYKDFPILHKEHNGHRVIYLDSGATAQIPQSVIDRVVEHMTQRNGNPHRGSLYILAIEASEDYENARDRVVEFINAREREEVVFTRNSTESMNLIAHSYGLHNVKKVTRLSLLLRNIMPIL